VPINLILVHDLTVVDLYEFARAAKSVKDCCCKTNQRATVMSVTERALEIKTPR
jgi:hypothetical protein